MNAPFRNAVPGTFLSRVLLAAVFAISGGVLAGCGSGDAPPPAEFAPAPVSVAPLAVAPTITQQPTSITTAPGQAATFTVAATGTAPLAYQWLRGGVAIAGATSATYTLASTAATDSGATFRVVVSNTAGSVISADATLTVSAVSPVLTITQQPTNQSATAGAMVSFTVAATCSSGTLTVQWQRLTGPDYADIAGATSPTYTFTAASSDNGAQFRANLSCSGASATSSSTATLTIAMPSSVTLSEIQLPELRQEALFSQTRFIDPAPSGGWDFTEENAVRHIAADLSSVTYVAGGMGSNSGTADGQAQNARFNAPSGIAHAPSGIIYIADSNNNTIRVINDGTVTTLAGTATGAGSFADGTGPAAGFNFPYGIAVGPDGDLYVADTRNNRIRRVTVGGVVTTYAGDGTGGSTDAAVATAASFASPSNISIAANGDLYVSDQGNGRIRRIVRVGNGAGAVQTVAGTNNGTNPFSLPQPVDGPGLTALINSPGESALSGTTLYVSDASGLVRTVDTVTGIVGTFAGSKTLGVGYADGAVGTGRLDIDAGIALSASGGLVVADNGRLRTIDATGNLVTFAYPNNDPVAIADGTGTGVLAQRPFLFSQGSNTSVPTTSLVVDATGQIDVSQNPPNTVRRIGRSGNVTLVAGLVGSLDGPLNGIGSTAELVANGAALAIAADGTLYVSTNYGVQKILADGTTTLFSGSSTQFGNLNGPAMNGSATMARFNTISGLAVAPSGDVFVSDYFGIRRIDAAGNVSAFSTGYTGQLVFGPDGTLYVDSTTGIRRVAADGTVGPNIPGVAAGSGFAVDAAGDVFAASNGITLVDPTGVATKLISTGPNVILGNVAPSLGPDIQAVYAYAPRQLLIVSGGRLLLLTMP